MARERMAKLLQYGHCGGRIGHIIINFMIISKCQHQRGAKEHRFLNSWPSDEDLAYTMRSATSNYRRKKCMIKIECADLENDAKTTCSVAKLSVNFVVATSCAMTPYYSLSLSRISSTNHEEKFFGSWRVSAWRNG